MTHTSLTHLISTECDGLDEKPEITQDVRQTAEYQETMTEPGSPDLIKTLGELANLGKTAGLLN